MAKKTNDIEKAAIDAHLRMLVVRLYGELIGTLEAFCEYELDKNTRERVERRIEILKKEAGYED